MLAAAFRGDAAGVKWHLEEGADINYLDGKWGTTPLMAAAAPTQRLEVLKVLLRRKDLNKDAVNKRGMTALHQAAWYGQKEAVHLLLTMGASEDPKTEDGYSAAEIAKMMGHEETSQLFGDAEEERRKSNIESADALRARLKSQHLQRSGKNLVVPALPPPLPLYKPDTPPPPPVRTAPETKPQQTAPEPDLAREEERRPQFEGAGGGGPMKKWAHETSERPGEEATAAPKNVPPRARDEPSRANSGRNELQAEAASSSTGTGPAPARPRTVQRETPAVLAADIIDESEADPKRRGALAKPRKQPGPPPRPNLNMGKRYEHRDDSKAPALAAQASTSNSGTSNPDLESDQSGSRSRDSSSLAARPRAQSSLATGSGGADSEWEGSFFLTQKPPSRPASGTVPRRESRG